tara:strand:- start:19 stop:486 length:468 start_codon:yes stop_codon:yes gene_type:complete
MKETIKETGKKLLSIVRLISFLPLGFLGGTLFQIIFIFVVEIITGFSPFGGKINFDDYWRGGAIWVGIIAWVATYFISYFIKPRFVSIKQFVICWSFVIGIFAAMTVNNLINPPYKDFLVHKDIFKTIIPLGVLVWIVKDKKNGLYNFEATRNKE